MQTQLKPTNLPTKSSEPGRQYKREDSYHYQYSQIRERQSHNREQQLQQQNQESQSQQQPDQKPFDQADEGDQSKENLLKEISKRKRQIKLLENRAMEAEKKYIQFATLEESEPQKQLREYKQYAEQKYAAYDTEVRGLHQHAKSLEQHLSDVMTKLDASISELIMVKADTTQHQSNLDGEWLSGITEYRSMHEADMIEMGTLTLQINQLKKQIMENQEIAESRGATVMSSLTSYINFCEKFTGLTIIDYEINDDVDVAKVTCRQTGKLGSIEYRLEFFADSDGKGQAYYIPLNDELEDRKLATSMNSELQFQQADTGVFIWRLMTYLNRPKSDKK